MKLRAGEWKKDPQQERKKKKGDCYCQSLCPFPEQS